MRTTHQRGCARCHRKKFPACQRHDHPLQFRPVAAGLQFTLAPENLTTFAHFAVSSAMKVLNCADGIGSVSPPRSFNRDLISGSASPATILVLSLSMIVAGVPLGAPIPFQADASNPGIVSAIDGTSGSTSVRLATVTANGRTLPARMKPIAVETVIMKAWTCPENKSGQTAAGPR